MNFSVALMVSSGKDLTEYMKDGRMEWRNYGITLFMIFLFLAWSAVAFTDFSGKVVAVKDGDTLEVMKEDVAVQVRLYGIDCPEKGQALGQREKQFASDLAFGKSEAKAFSK